jgi:hypothetical protein
MGGLIFRLKPEATCLRAARSVGQARLMHRVASAFRRKVGCALGAPPDTTVLAEYELEHTSLA